MLEKTMMIGTEERRRDQRIPIPVDADVHVTDGRGVRLGRVLVLARGGILLETDHAFERGCRYELLIVDQSNGIRRPIEVSMLDERPAGVVLTFHRLPADAAMEIGVMIGRYYSATL